MLEDVFDFPSLPGDAQVVDALLFRYYGMGLARSLPPRVEWATPCRVNYPSVR
jgi:hypothetical protein